MRLSERNFLKVLLPSRRLVIDDSPGEGVWVYHLADKRDHRGKGVIGGAGMLLNEPFDVAWARAGDLVGYCAGRGTIPYVVASCRFAQAAPAARQSGGCWSQADLEGWARDRGDLAKAEAASFLLEAQDEFRRAFPAIRRSAERLARLKDRER